ncbi:MAG TPA: hypothetical protein PKE00_00845 [Planctomycetota bacterium]|nr:hypothetical protein [Planctomycetota bacterium]
MTKVRLRIVDDATRAAFLRAEDLQAATRKNPELVLVGSTGKTPIATYARLGEIGADLSSIKLRMLDSYLSSPSRGFQAPEHRGSFTRYVIEKILEPLDQSRRPIDWVMPPEEITTCEQVFEELEAQVGRWERPRHPMSGVEGSEFVLHDDVEGQLALVRRTCAAYDRLLESAPIDIVMTGLGPLPYPHLAFNCGPYTRHEALTHLALLDDATRRANCADFDNDMENVPPLSITMGPRSVTRAMSIWITATGSQKSTAVAHAFSDPRAEDFELRSSIGYVLRSREVDLVFDEEAAEDLLADGGFQGLEARYAEVGHELVARRI